MNLFVVNNFSAHKKYKPVATTITHSKQENESL